MLDDGTIWQAIQLLDGWVQKHDYQGYEPFDGLNSWLRPMLVGRVARQALIQLNLRAPVNLRPILGITTAITSKGMAYFARGYLKLFHLSGDARYHQKADRCLDWLRQNPSAGQPGMSWGNHFDYQTRGYYLPKGDPTVVWTSVCGHAFVDAFEILGRPADLQAASEVARFVVEGLERRRFGNGLCISYVPGTYTAIHNANLQAAGLLARVYRHTKDETLRQIAASAVQYTVDCQRSNGSWWYGEEDKFHWTDNWHTSQLLDGLWWYIVSTGDSVFGGSFERGVRFWVDHFFLPNGTPKFYWNHTYPIDIQCASQGIESLSLYAEAYDSSCLPLGEKVAAWTIQNMQDRDGHFYFRRWRHWVNRTPMLHWGQATMLHGLVCLLVARDRARESPSAKINTSKTAAE